MNTKRGKERGFTLPELLVLVAVFGVLAALSLLFIRPQDHGPAQRNGERLAGAAQLAHALKHYAQDNGGLPKGVGSEEEALIGNDEGMLDLCDELVPAYLEELPVEPMAVVEGASCREDKIPLITGYAVKDIGDNKFEVSAPLAEDDEVIVTQSY